MHISIGPAAVKQAKTSHSLPGLSESYRGSPRQHHCVLCVFSSLPADSHRCEPHAHCLLLFLGGGGGVVLLSLPQICREILLVPGEASHRTDRLPPAAVIEGMKKTRGERSVFNPPDATKRRGLHFSSAGCIHQSCRFLLLHHYRV